MVDESGNDSLSTFMHICKQCRTRIQLTKRDMVIGNLFPMEPVL